jgi:hypothetical protein
MPNSVFPSQREDSGQWLSDLRGKKVQCPSTSYLEAAVRLVGKKKGPLVAWSDLLVIVSSRCWHYDSSGLPDWLKRAHELPHTVIVLRLSTRCLRIRN